MDSIIREVFANYPDNLKHYEALFLAQGNMGEAFGNSDLIASNGGIGGGKEYEASTEVQKKIVNAAYITPSPVQAGVLCRYRRSIKMQDLIYRRKYL